MLDVKPVALVSDPIGVAASSTVGDAHAPVATSHATGQLVTVRVSAFVVEGETPSEISEGVPVCAVLRVRPIPSILPEFVRVTFRLTREL